MWEDLREWILSSNRQLLLTGAAALAVFLASKALRKALLFRVTDIESRHKIRRWVSWTSVVAFIAVAALIWAQQIGNLGLFISIIGAGLALSLQETLLCLAGWGLILLKKPFDIGDRLEIGGLKGDVIDIDLFQVSLLEVGNWVDSDQSTGRLAVMPNSMIFRHSAYNYTKGFPFIWNEFAAVVTFESDWLTAKDLMLRQAQEEAGKIEQEVKSQIQAMQRQYAIHYEHLLPIVYTSIADHGVKLTLRYLSPVRQRRATMHRISEGILDAYLAHPGIDFAYPTTRYFDNGREGKLGRKSDRIQAADQP